jgi:hypothetical protein
MQMEDSPVMIVARENSFPPRSLSTVSRNSSVLDLPSTMYMIEDASVKSSTASFATTGRSETPTEPPTPYDDIFRDQAHKVNQSPTTLWQMRARSRSLGMIGVANNDFAITPVQSPLPTPPMSPSPSWSSSLDLSLAPIPDIPTPPYEELEDLPENPLLLTISPDSFQAERTSEDDDFVPPWRFSVRPRPEEGNETLPDYSCTVFRSGITNQKIECVYPGLPAKKREWVRVYMLLLGTVLRVYPIQPDGSLPSKFSVNYPHREYTLQYAEAGIASDYVKKKSVLRVRVEGEQFLMQCSDHDERDAWVEAVQAGSSIALALEDRKMPKYVTLPRRRRGRYSSASVSRSRPVLLRTPQGNRFPLLQTVQSAPSISSTTESHSPQQSSSSTTTSTTSSGLGCCNEHMPQDPYADAATALALCLDAGRIHINTRERIVVSVLTARQHRQNEWVIINGVKRQINPKTGELEGPLPPASSPEEGEHRARLMKSKRGLASRVFKFF